MKMSKIEWVLDMIEQRIQDAYITYDVLNDYSEEDLEKIAEFLECVFDFEMPENGCIDCKKQRCLNEKCDYEYYLND